MALQKPGIKGLRNIMGSKHLDSWRRPLRFKTIIKLRGITMTNNQDNEKQMAPLVQKKIDPPILPDILLHATALQLILQSRSCRTMDDCAWPVKSLNLFSQLSVLNLASRCRFALVKPNVPRVKLLCYLNEFERDRGKKKKEFGSLKRPSMHARLCKSAKAFC